MTGSWDGRRPEEERSGCMKAAVWFAKVLGALAGALLLVLALAALAEFVAQVLR